jgi:ribonuclease Z
LKTWISGALLVALVLTFGGLWALRAPLALDRFRAEEDATLGRSLPARGDGLTLAVCGAAADGAVPDEAGPCLYLQAGAHRYLIDAGDGALRSLNRLRLAPERLDGVILTGLGAEEAEGLGAVLKARWTRSGAATPLPVFGPKGIETILPGLALFTSLDRDAEVARHGAVVTPPTGATGEARPFDPLAPKPAPDGTPPGAAAPSPPPASGEAMLVETDGVSISAFAAADGARGLIAAYKGRKAVILSGRPTPASLAFVRGADLLVAEAASPRLVAEQIAAAQRAGRPNLAHILSDRRNDKASPEAVAALATRAQVRRLVLVRLSPPVSSGALEDVFLGQARNLYRGPLTRARDGDVMFLPARSNKEFIYRR